MTAAMIGLAVPTFVIGPLLQLVFGMLLHALPVAGYEGKFAPQYLILPSIALALFQTAVAVADTRRNSRREAQFGLISDSSWQTGRLVAHKWWTLALGA